MTTRAKWEREVRTIFGRIATHKEEYVTEVEGTGILILPNVFSPAYFTDSGWFAKAVSNIVGKGKVLEIRTGTGVVALFCAKNGATVTATDINPDAVRNAELNFKENEISAECHCGDMYEPIPQGERYDFLFWNHPFNRGENPDEEMLLRSGFDYRYESLEKYFSGARERLNPFGKLLLGTGSYASLSDVERLAEKYGYAMHLSDKIDIQLTDGSTVKNDYRIYELMDVR
ncbi:MAG: methyltransferase [Candidatus Moranbacteria bacterium]|nr:methyltransferase [Candidatus Moranbacteria bacterium]